MLTFPANLHRGGPSEVQLDPSQPTQFYKFHRVACGVPYLQEGDVSPFHAASGLSEFPINHRHFGQVYVKLQLSRFQPWTSGGSATYHTVSEQIERVEAPFQQTSETDTVGTPGSRPARAVLEPWGRNRRRIKPQFSLNWSCYSSIRFSSRANVTQPSCDS